MEPSRWTIPKLVGLGLLGLTFLFLLFGSFYTIDQRQRGVITTFGKITSVAEPGLGFKVPFITTLNTYDVGTQTSVWDKTERENTSLHSYSFDQQPAEVAVQVAYHVPADKVTDVYSRFGTAHVLKERILEPRVRAVFKNVFGSFTAVSAVQDRPKLNRLVHEALVKSVEGEPIVIESVNVINIDFSDAYEQSIEQRMQAEVEVQKLRQNAEREKVQAQIVVTKATAEADATRQRAQANSEAITLTGEAEAKAIRARAQALGENPNLVSLTQAEKWNGVLPSTMVPGGSVPMLNLTK